MASSTKTGANLQFVKTSQEVGTGADSPRREVSFKPPANPIDTGKFTAQSSYDAQFEKRGDERRQLIKPVDNSMSLPHEPCRSAIVTLRRKQCSP